MKKVLFATTAIVLSAGAAAADVKLSGTARVGLAYNEFVGVKPAGFQETQVNMRLRFNIDASKETDAGVTMGGRIRLQYDQNSTTTGTDGGAARLNAAYVYASFGGFTVQVGNANEALDSTKLLYASEIGYIGQSFGNSHGSFAAYRTGNYVAGQDNRMGLFASYALPAGTVRLSYITPDQTNSGAVEEFSMSADYVFGPVTVSGGFALDGNFIANNDVYFLGGEYAINSAANVGLLVHYTDNCPTDETTATLYGNYTSGAITYRGYIANNNRAGNLTDTAFGVGADYDLGGATLAGHIARGYSEQMQASLGVKFSF